MARQLQWALFLQYPSSGFVGVRNRALQLAQRRHELDPEILGVVVLHTPQSPDLS